MITFYLINGKELTFKPNEIKLKRNEEGDYIVITKEGKKRYDIKNNAIAYLESTIL